MEELDPRKPGEAEIDIHNLYREETFSDLKVGSIQMLHPVRPDGSPDDLRKPIFMGEAHVMTPMGPAPLQAPIEAETLEEAITKFPQAVEEAVNRLIEEARNRQREEASRIVTPGAMGPGDVTL